MESKKPKLFISQPMHGKSAEEILAEREEAIKEAKRLVECDMGVSDMEVIDSFIRDAPAGANPLWFLGKSLELMSDADVVYFAEGWQKARGCQLEYEYARAYTDDDFVYYEHERCWIPCAERLPEMHEEVDYTGRQEESDFVLVCDASELHPQVHVGRCSRIGDKVWWMTREWKVLDKVTAWMPLPETYSGSGQE